MFPGVARCDHAASTPVRVPTTCWRKRPYRQGDPCVLTGFTWTPRAGHRRGPSWTSGSGTTWPSRPNDRARLMTAIDVVFTRHQRLWQESKEEAIQALSAGFTEKMARLRTELSARDATVSSIAQYFEDLVDSLTERSHLDPEDEADELRLVHAAARVVPRARAARPLLRRGPGRHRALQVVQRHARPRTRRPRDRAGRDASSANTSGRPTSSRRRCAVTVAWTCTRASAATSSASSSRTLAAPATRSSSRTASAQPSSRYDWTRVDEGLAVQPGARGRRRREPADGPRVRAPLPRPPPRARTGAARRPVDVRRQGRGLDPRPRRRHGSPRRRTRRRATPVTSVGQASRLSPCVVSRRTGVSSVA